MKKKIISSILMVFILLAVVMPKNVWATNFNNSFYSYYIPNRYEAGYENVTSDSSFKSYRAYEGDVFSSISFSAYKFNFLKQYTTTDLNERIQLIKDIYDGDDGYKLTNISGQMIELNGVKGYRVTYFVRYEGYKVQEYGYDVYELRSDNYDYTIDIDSSKSFINSTEEKKIVNSFKIKDTVLKSKNIPFVDVASKSWYFNAVEYAYDNKIISGYNDYTFAPDDKLTRGMIVTMLYKMEGSPNNDGKSKFTDVAPKEYYAKAIKWAVEKDIVHGYNNSDKFGPNDYVLRQDLAGILRNYASYKKKNVGVTTDLSKYSDYKKIDKYANQSMQWAVGKGVITGNANGTLAPKGNATRAEAAAMIQKYCQKVGR